MNAVGAKRCMRGTGVGSTVVVALVLVFAGTVTAIPNPGPAQQGVTGTGPLVAVQPSSVDGGQQTPNEPDERLSDDFGDRGADAGTPSALTPLVEAVAATDAGVAESAQVYEEPARAGAEAALDRLAVRGVAIDDETRSAAIQGAVAGAALVEASSGEARPTDATVRIAADGAVSGALVGADRGDVSPDTVRSAVSGALAGASLATALGVGQGGVADRLPVFGAAYGGAEGAVVTVAGLPSEHLAALTPDHVQLAASGGAGGAAGAASLLPIFGDRVAANPTRGAAFGAAAGALRGTGEQLAETGRVEPGQTLGASLGASAGTLSATLQRTDLTAVRLSGTAYSVGRGTVRHADALTQGQMAESALTVSVERLVGDAGGDSVFPSAIVLPRYNIAIGPPRDVDADGQYEDVNGNRVLTYSDVVSLSIIRSLYSQGAIQLTEDQRRGLDFNGDDVFDWRDIRALDEEITAITNGSG